MTGFGGIAGDAQVRSEVERELGPGERLRWCSRANPEALARQARVIGLFGIPFLAFSLFWTLGALAAAVATKGLLFFFPLFGLPFCGVGVWLVTAPSRARRQGQSTYYGVSDRRAIIIVAVASRSVRSWGRREMQGLSRTERADGTGDVIFSRDVGRDSDGNRTSTSIGFFGIRDARFVESLLREIMG